MTQAQEFIDAWQGGNKHQASLVVANFLADAERLKTYNIYTFDDGSMACFHLPHLPNRQAWIWTPCAYDKDRMIKLADWVNGKAKCDKAITAMVCQEFCHPENCSNQTRLDIAGFWDEAVRNGFICC